MDIPSPSEAVDFLKAVYPEGPWALTAINVDSPGIVTQTFYPADEKELRKWVKSYNDKWNMYWHVNPVMRPITSKAQRTDILSVNYLHVDIDASSLRPKSDILNALEAGHSDVPPPTIIISSGGGYQAFWKLKDPIAINGVLELAERAKLYNQQLENIFKADNCHNIDRLCRLPGTVNLPNAKKRSYERVETLAIVHSCHLDRVYPIESFSVAVVTQINEPTVSFPPTQIPTISGNIRRLTGANDPLLSKVPDRIKVIMVQGCVPDEPKERDNSRSAWLFDCVCGLVRADCSDETIYSVLTDPDFKISESVLEQASRSEQYALRQIARAREEAISPELRELNDRHAVIGNWGGQCRIIEEVDDGGRGRKKLTKQTRKDFEDFYGNRFIVVGMDRNGIPQRVPLGKWWFIHPQRRQYRTIVFSPKGDVKECYNLWRGFACSSRAGDCSLYLGHLLENICSGNKEYFEYVINWMARCVQHPDSQGEVAIVLRGKKGVGKGKTVRWFGNLFGRHFLQIANAKHMVGSFNAHLRDTVVLFADEAFWAGDKQHESVLKMLITEETLAIEAKGVDVVSSLNYVHLIMSSNNEWVVPASGDERRFFVLDVGDDKIQNFDYFAAIDAQMANGGLEALLHLLLSRDISSFQVRSIPKTNALVDQKICTMPYDTEWWYNKLRKGKVLDSDHEWPEGVFQRELFEDFTVYMKKVNSQTRMHETGILRLMNRMLPVVSKKMKMGKFRVFAGTEGFTAEVHRKELYLLLPPLRDCQDHFEKLHGVPFNELQPELYPREDVTPVAEVM